MVLLESRTMSNKESLSVSVHVRTKRIFLEPGQILVQVTYLHRLFNVVETMVTLGRLGGCFIGPAQFEVIS